MKLLKAINKLQSRLFKWRLNRAINEAEKNDKPQGNGVLPCVVRSLGVATTIGELKKIIENYPDEVSFGFRNQPMQELHEVKYPDVVFVVFQ